MKTLRVCLSKDLPGLLDRKSDYLYFLYDKLFLYSGQNLIDVNFAIVDSVPEEQIDGMIYILNTDGSVHRKVDYKDTIVAKIEDDSQIDLLKKAGTMFYVNAEHRYMDSQRRILTLPYNDGNYELAVAAKNDAKFNNNTILKYSEKDERFEIFGEIDEEFIDFSKPFRGKETDTVKVTVDGPKIAAMIKISNAIGNIIKAAGDGLVVNPTHFVDRKTFDEWINSTIDFKKYAQAILDRVDSELSSIKDLVTPEYIHDEVLGQLIPKYPTIETAIENYQQVVESLDDIEKEVMDYSSRSIVNATNAIDKKIDEISNWENLDDSYQTYKSEVDYYQKSEKNLYPDFTKSELLAVIGAAMSKYFEDQNIDDIIISAAMAIYLSEVNKEE